MTTYARNVGGQAIDVTTTDPATIFHADIAAQFIVVPAGTETGAMLVNGVWVNPPAPAPAPAPTIIPPIVDVPTFYSLFTIQEQMAIEGSTDPIVATAWKRFTDPRVTFVNLALGSVQNLLAYFSTTNQQPAVTPAATYIQPARVAQILTGVPQ
jgi:hypothetical protein